MYVSAKGDNFNTSGGKNGWILSFEIILTVLIIF